MSTHLPYFKFNSGEWLSKDIVFESDATQGVFAYICALYWNEECNLTMDQLLKRKTKEQLQPLLDGKFITVKRGNVSIRFLDLQFEELDALHQKRVKAGRKGGKATQSKEPSEAKAPLKQGSSIKIRQEEDKIREDIRTSTIYLQSVAGSFHITMESLKAQLERFLLNPKEHDSLNDLKTHFTNWLGKQAPAKGKK